LKSFERSAVPLHSHALLGNALRLRFPAAHTRLRSLRPRFQHAMIGVFTNLKRASCLEIREFRDFSFALVLFARQELLTRIEFKAVHLRLCHLLSTPGSSATASHMSRTAASKCGVRVEKRKSFHRAASLAVGFVTESRAKSSKPDSADYRDGCPFLAYSIAAGLTRQICPFRAIRARGGRELTLERGCIVNGRAISSSRLPFATDASAANEIGGFFALAAVSKPPFLAWRFSPG
jgi:hypothetical protein